MFGGSSEFKSGQKPANWFQKAMFAAGGRSASGMHVTPETAMGFIAVYACVKLLSESVAQLPCVLYRKTDNDGGREKATDHPLYDMLRNTPNGWQTAFDYHEYQQAGLGLRGNAYGFIEWSNKGQIQSIIPLNPAKVTTKIGSDRMPVYTVEDEAGLGEIPFRNMHHIAGFKTNPYVGMSPIAAARDGLGLSLATEEHAGLVFANGTKIGGVLEREWKDGAKPLGRDQIDTLKEQWSSLYSGLQNSGKVAVLQDGFKFKSISMSNEDAQLMLSRVHSINEVARLYNIPPHMIQLLDKATFSNIESQALQFVMYSMMPNLKRHESSQMRDLLTKKERSDGYYIEYNVSGLLRGDMQTRFESYAQARQWGWMSVNDIRRLENLPPIKGGDKYLQPLNMVDAEKELSDIKNQVEE
jgi:HK97 family phage portal protein